MQGDKRSNKALKSTYIGIENNELRQTLEAVTVPSTLSRRVKELNNLYNPMYFILMFT
jgi:hypothetical protein